jgi:invasion protein IalB
MDNELIVELIKEVQCDLSHQIDNLGEKLSLRIAALETVRKRQKSFLKTVILPIILTIVSGSVVYVQDHIYWRTNVEASK